MKMITVKKPEFENDDYLIRLDVTNIPLGEEAIRRLKNLSPDVAAYYDTKRNAFASHNIKPSIFAEFAESRPSLRSLMKLPSLRSTIYTVACEKHNNVNYTFLLEEIKKHLTKKPDTRRCVVRFANPFTEYSDSEMLSPQDVTCLNLIHYFKDSPRLVFRASDVENELLIDILTITEFFIKPIYSKQQINLSVYSSTCQNHEKWQNFIDSYNLLTGK